MVVGCSFSAPDVRAASAWARLLSVSSNPMVENNGGLILHELLHGLLVSVGASALAGLILVISNSGLLVSLEASAWAELILVISSSGVVGRVGL